MKALAIDFETANETRGSACAIGLAWIENGAVTRREHRLIRPREMRFNYHNIKVHGIRPEDVEDQPEFPDVIAEFLPDFAGGLVLAHNASFDIGVLCTGLRDYGLPNPEFGYFCTLTLSRHLWPELGGASLDVVARHFGIQFRHHDASEDAFACAQIALIAARQMGLVRMSDVFPKASLQLGRVRIDGHFPCAGIAARKAPRLPAAWKSVV